MFHFHFSPLKEECIIVKEDLEKVEDFVYCFCFYLPGKVVFMLVCFLLVLLSPESDHYMKWEMGGGLVTTSLRGAALLSFT